MRVLGLLTSGKFTAAATVVVLIGMYTARGGTMFSSGPLSDKHRGREKLGGVSSHAEIAGNCSACHAPAWSKQTMTDRCLDCHTNVRTQLDEKKAMHGRVPNARDCRRCHSEHKGEHAALTSMAGFEHTWTDFKLAGKHADLDCKSCHKSDEAYDDHRGAAHTCVSCHADTHHKGKMGNNCVQCHKETVAWKETTFTHRFPINHGARRRSSSNGNACSVCHKDETNLSTYTCYGCHEHQPAKIERIHSRRRVANLDKCVECHDLGRKKGRERRGDAGPGDALERWVTADDATEADVWQGMVASLKTSPVCPGR